MPRSPVSLLLPQLSYTIIGVLETHKNKNNFLKACRKGTLKSFFLHFGGLGATPLTPFPAAFTRHFQ
jgi:hypothetical protein